MKWLLLLVSFSANAVWIQIEGYTINLNMVTVMADRGGKCYIELIRGDTIVLNQSCEKVRLVIGSYGGLSRR